MRSRPNFKLWLDSPIRWLSHSSPSPPGERAHTAWRQSGQVVTSRNHPWSLSAWEGCSI